MVYSVLAKYTCIPFWVCMYLAIGVWKISCSTFSLETNTLKSAFGYICWCLYNFMNQTPNSKHHFPEVNIQLNYYVWQLLTLPWDQLVVRLAVTMHGLLLFRKDAWYSSVEPSLKFFWLFDTWAHCMLQSYLMFWLSMQILCQSLRSNAYMCRYMYSVYNSSLVFQLEN